MYPFFVQENVFKCIKSNLGFKGMPPEMCQQFPLAGRLKHFLHNWEKLTQDQWALQTIKGVRIEFMDTPYQRNIPSQPRQSEHNEKRLLQEEITSMLKKGAIRELQGETRNGFYSNMFLVPKKRWEGETSYQPEKIESICSHPSLQDGGHTNSQRAGSTKRLDDQNRPKGCLLHNTSRRASPKVPQVRDRPPNLPVHLSAVRTVECPLGFYQDLEASGSETQRVWNTARDIPGRYIGDSKQPKTISRPHLCSNLHTGESGLYCSPREVNDPTHPEGGVSGNDYRFDLDGTSGSLPQDKKNQGRGTKHATSKQYISTRSIALDRENDLSYPNHSASPIVLQEPPERSILGISKQQSELRCSMPPLTREQRGTAMVDRPPLGLEREESHKITETRCSDRVGCIPQRMGSNLEWSQHRRPVECSRETLAHQLLGDTSSQLSGTNVCKEPNQRSSAPTTGQHNSCVLHKSPRGHSIPLGNLVSKGVMAMVPETEYLTKSTASPRQRECHSGPRIQGNGQVRLDVEPP